MNLFAMSQIFAASMLAMATFPGHAAPSFDDPLAIYRAKARVLVVIAPSGDDDRLRRQRDLFAAMKPGAEQRDLALVEAVGTSDEAQMLRRRFGLDDGFYAVLIGKDGGDKLTSSEPLGSEKLFPLIDAMPMRRQEMQGRSPG
jgi:Domain of unknown function (DUF4174)